MNKDDKAKGEDVGLPKCKKHVLIPSNDYQFR